MYLDAAGHAGSEAIVAFIDGDASREVASHIHGCARCSSDAAALQTAQVRLRQSLYRVDCPEPHRLGEYELGFVSPEERVQIASHALECSLCTEELHTLREFLAAAEPRLAGSVGSQIRRVFATLLSARPGLALGGVRGAATKLRQYAIDDARLSIGPGFDRGSLIGLLVPGTRELPARAEARMLSEDGAHRLTEVDALGNFEFEDLPAGSYVLEIELPDEIIVVEHLGVD
jgi:hypothetical protein